MKRASTSQKLWSDLVKIINTYLAQEHLLRGRDARENDQVNNLSDSHWKYFVNQKRALTSFTVCLEHLHSGTKWLQILIKMVTFVPSLANEMDQGQDNWHQPPVRAVTVTLHFAQSSSTVTPSSSLSSTHLSRLVSERGSDLNLCRYCSWTLFLTQILPGYLKFYSNFGTLLFKLET